MQQMPSLIPYLAVKDTQASMDWFEKLGFQLMYKLDGPDGKPAHAHYFMGDTHFMMGTPWLGDYQKPNTSVNFYVDLRDKDVDAYFRDLRGKGMEIRFEPMDQFWGDRNFGVTHPEGFCFTFSRQVRQVSPQEMQQAMAAMATAGP